MRKIMFFLMLIFIMPVEIFCGQLDSQIGGEDFEKINTVINETVRPREDFLELTKKVIRGEFNFFDLPKEIAEVFFRDLGESFSDIRELFLLIIISGVVKSLADSFGVKELVSFYISFLLAAMNIFIGFRDCVGIAQNFLQDLLHIVQAALPFVISLAVMGGHISAGSTFSPALFFICDAIIVIINFLIPAVTMFVSIQIINNMCGRLTNFAQLIKNLITWALKIISMGFMAVLSLQRISFPILENAVVKTAKFVVNSVPVVGEIFSGAVGSVISWAYVVKNGALLALLIVILFLCMVPIVKLVIWILLYKIFAALVEPICDERIIKSLGGAADACILLLGCCFSGAVIFIFAVGILISI